LIIVLCKLKKNIIYFSMNDIYSFVNELRNNTESNMDNRKAREEHERQLNDKKLDDCIAKLTDSIMEQCEERMVAASKDGHYYATLYEFTNQCMYEDYKTVFLVKGPIRSRGYDGLAFFEHRGIEPLLQRLSKRLTPMGVFVKYDRNKRAYLLIATWKNT
jgi:type IV secretory pathway VirB4 component